MENPNVPNFGELLAPFISQVPEEAFPNFLALLERGAAQRYREWAELLPQHEEGLNACAASEDKIADIVEGLFPIADSLTEAIAAPLPAATSAYYKAFAGLSMADQLEIQADAELQGAAAWQGMLTDSTPDTVRQGLAQCSDLERESSAYLYSIIDQVRAAQ